ncbi:MAG: hypothetical protein AAGJ18_13775 [Bacteroidota bacterium]
MAKSSELNFKTYLKSFTQFKIKQLEALIKELNVLLLKKKQQNNDFDERALISQLNRTVLNKEKRALYRLYSKKVEEETITPAEKIAFDQLADEAEQLRNKRVKILIDLAQLRGVSLPTLMQDLGLNPPHRA